MDNKKIFSLEEFLKENDKQIKGYAFDSLVFRYKIAREEQMRYEKYRYSREGLMTKADNAESRAERDIMRFIEILNEIIGEHD